MWMPRWATRRAPLLVVVNSVCGCAAGAARPALALALRHAHRPQQVVTVFAGQDIEATARARQYFADYAPSSPSVALFRDGEVVHFVHRHMIEGHAPQEIAKDADRGIRQALRHDFGLMTGHVFHPGHSDLHGITVVLETTGDALYVGRYHEETAAGVLLHDVAEHRPEPGGVARDEFLAQDPQVRSARRPQAPGGSHRPRCGASRASSSGNSGTAPGQSSVRP